MQGPTDVMITPQVAAQGYGLVSHGTDAACIVRFFEEDREVSVLEGQEPRTRRMEMIEIKFAGQKNTVVARKSTAQDRERFYAQYQAFKNGLEGPVGTPLEQAPFVAANARTLLQKLDVHTIEQLAALSDQTLQAVRLPHARQLREQARSFVARGPERAAAGAQQAMMQAALTEERHKSAALEERLARLEALLTAAPAKGEPKPKPTGG